MTLSALTTNADRSALSAFDINSAARARRAARSTGLMLSVSDRGAWALPAPPRYWEAHYQQRSAPENGASPAGRQRRKRDAVDCTAAQAVAAALLASGMGNTVMASGPRPRLRSGGNSVHCWKCSATPWHEPCRRVRIGGTILRCRFSGAGVDQLVVKTARALGLEIPATLLARTVSGAT